jgi:hypothetical protein
MRARATRRAERLGAEGVGEVLGKRIAHAGSEGGCLCRTPRHECPPLALCPRAAPCKPTHPMLLTLSSTVSILVHSSQACVSLSPTTRFLTPLQPSPLACSSLPLQAPVVDGGAWWNCGRGQGGGIHGKEARGDGAR